MSRGFVPKRSPFSLLQEDVWRPGHVGTWRVLVACSMLNCTSRRQVERVIHDFFKSWPTPESIVDAMQCDVADKIFTLGFANRRAGTLIKLGKALASGDVSDVRALPGVGEYVARSWEMVCADVVGDVEPSDHALVLYYRWRKFHEQRQKDR